MDTTGSSAATTREWDEWLSLFANRDEVAVEYAEWLHAYYAAMTGGRP